MLCGAAFASILRYICHVISGATIWAGLSIPTEAALVYSLSYNATYMIPETIILLLSAAYIGSALDFRTATPVRMKSESFSKKQSIYLGCAGFALLAALICDTVLVFSKLQNYENGEFTIRALAEVNWLAAAIVTAVALIAAAVLFFIAKKESNSK